MEMHALRCCKAPTILPPVVVSGPRSESGWNGRMITPDLCPFCKSIRTFVQDGRVGFGCGSVGQQARPRPHFRRTVECIWRSSRPVVVEVQNRMDLYTRDLNAAASKIMEGFYK